MTLTMLSLTAPGEGGATYSYPSYVTVEEADEYLLSDPELMAEWFETSAADRARRLVAATRRLDRLPWKGERAGGSAQATAWPREGVVWPDGSAVATTDIPAAIDEAVYLLAGDLLVDLSGAAGGRQEQVRSLTAGRITESFFYEELSELALLLPGGTLSLLKYWLQSAKPARRPTVTGRDKNRPSEFSERYSREVWSDSVPSYGSRRR